MIVDCSQAREFLELLSEDKHHIFLTFDDQPEKNKDLVKVYHGTLSNYEDKLALLNERGAGVFVAINTFNKNSRRKENLSTLRAVWQEDDSKGSAPIPELEPSIVVETSKGKYHRYWILDTPSVNVGLWSSIMGVMVSKFKSDKNAKDVSRVMRLPGFYHNKDLPFKTRIVSSSGKRYTMEELAAYFIPGFKEKQEQKAQEEANRPRDERRVADFTEAGAMEAILTGTNFHGAMCSFSMHKANDGNSVDEIKAQLTVLMNASLQKNSDRWKQRMGDLDAIVTSAVNKVRDEIEEEAYVMESGVSSESFKFNLEEYRKSPYLHHDEFTGRLNDITLCVMQHMRYPSYELAFEIALHAVSTFSGSYYCYENLPNSRKIIVLTEQGRGKDIARDFMVKLVIGIISRYKETSLTCPLLLGAGDYTSPRQFHLELQEMPIRSMVMSEAGHAEATKVGDRSGLIKYINQLLTSKPRDMIEPRKQNDIKGGQTLRTLYTVSASILHESVPNNYAKLLMDGEQFADGTMSRSNILFIDPDISEEHINLSSPNAKIPDDIIDFFYNLHIANRDNHCFAGTESKYPAAFQIPTDDDAMRQLVAMEYQQINERRDSDPYDYVKQSMLIRKTWKVKMMSKLLAIGNHNTSDPLGTLRITHEHVDFARYRQEEIDKTLVANTQSGLLASTEDRVVKWCVQYLHTIRNKEPAPEGTLITSNLARLSALEFQRNGIEGCRITMMIDKMPKQLLSEWRSLSYIRYKSPKELKYVLADLLTAKGVLRPLPRRLDGKAYRERKGMLGHFGVTFWGRV